MAQDISLGGSRCTLPRTCFNLFLTFFIGGIWHGAGWTFVIWGTFHGLATVVHRLWRQTGLHLNKFFAWFITFNFVNFAWIFFKADLVKDAWTVVRKMFDLSWYQNVNGSMTLGRLKELVFCDISMDTRISTIGVLCAFLLCVCFKNSKSLYEKFVTPSYIKIFILSSIFCCIVYHIMNSSGKIEFLYWQF